MDKETLWQNGCVDSLQMSDALCHKVVISNGPRPCMWIASRGTFWLGNHLWKAIAFGFPSLSHFLKCFVGDVSSIY